MTTPSRGDIAWVSFPEGDDVPDEEMDDPHMAVVLQPESVSRDLGSTIVVPITSGQSSSRIREVDIPSHNEPVDEHSYAVLPLMTAVSIPERIHDEGEEEGAWKQGELSNEKLGEIQDRLGYLLGV